MINKRGQVVIFVIIAIVVIAGIVAYILTRDSKVISLKDSSFEVEKVQTEVRTCVEDSLNDAINLNGQSGGYFFPDKDFVLVSFPESASNRIAVPYYLIGETVEFPNKLALEEELSRGVNSQIVSCLELVKEDSSLLESFDYSEDKIEVKSYIFNDKIKFNIKIPLVLKNNQSFLLFNNINLEKSSNYFKLYNLAVNLTEEQALHPSDFCITCTEDLANFYNISISTKELDKDNNYVILYYLTKENSEDNLVEYFSFSHKLDFATENEE